MSHQLHKLMHLFAHEAHKQHKYGKDNKATGLTSIALGIFALPVPIIGIPLIGHGIWKLFKKD